MEHKFGQPKTKENGKEVWPQWTDFEVRALNHELDILQQCQTVNSTEIKKIEIAVELHGRLSRAHPGWTRNTHAIKHKIGHHTWNVLQVRV
eukprot:g2124.t1